MILSYSRGHNTYDNHPEQRSAPDLKAFASALLSDRQAAKGQGYVCAPLNSDGRRCTEGSMPRAWLPIDVDGVEAEVHQDFRLWLARFQGFGWPTASSTPHEPRERVILTLSRPVDRAEGIAIGRVLANDIAEEFGDAVKVDPCTFRAEQPCYLPVGKVRPFYFTGEPLDVDSLLAEAPTEAASGASDGTGVEDWLELLTSGADVHQGALRVVARMVAKGIDAAAIRVWFEGVAGTIAKARGPKRVHELLGRELDRMIIGASEKYRDHPADHAERYDEPPPHPVRILGFADFIKGYAPPVWLWERILRAGFLFALTALWGHAKTAVMLTVAAHVAAGRSIGGLRVERKRVLYLCGENPDDVRARVMAIARHFEIPTADLDGWIFFTERPFAVDSPAQLASFAEDAVRHAPYGLVVVDTGPAHTALDEENDNRQMHDLAIAMRDMMGVLGYPCLVALMHPSKGATRDNMQPRGGGAFSGNIDAELCLWKDGELVELYHASKNRAGSFAPLFFRIEPLELDGFADNFGRPPCTIVAVPIDEGTAEQAAQAQWRDENRVLWAMDMNPAAVFPSGPRRAPGCRRMASRRSRRSTGCSSP